MMKKQKSYFTSVDRACAECADRGRPCIVVRSIDRKEVAVLLVPLVDTDDEGLSPLNSVKDEHDTAYGTTRCIARHV